jgi:hypothetical protein
VLSYENVVNLESTTPIITGGLKGTSGDQTMDLQGMNDAMTNLDSFSSNRNAKTNEVKRSSEGTSSEKIEVKLKKVSSDNLEDIEGTNPADDRPASLVIVELQARGEANKKWRHQPENAMLTRSQKQMRKMRKLNPECQRPGRLRGMWS